MYSKQVVPLAESSEDDNRPIFSPKSYTGNQGLLYAQESDPMPQSVESDVLLAFQEVQDQIYGGDGDKKNSFKNQWNKR